ncbi:autophagocytosis associated protein, active-site protein (macronuclear) [Tetrahymena thermophila SB210]|uniref:Autophagocytosis associated protein, active-site protein n=1 Tax=Tetrahymena thermophila (strain SB210) TaxID=312017 RepID=Q22CS1_TETTS|nr:autophagocytosis associated protein, active-site protein [Tetrahymena thermophila SB210]EAR83117.2 autophagocytosis associated protein, active-site protein [Tetrahymena thermophila SB210]|eukprot:XP_001030780.2 autophagocytosis associated protein, active-site protein [Tetrahymena thermophila SB210]
MDLKQDKYYQFNFEQFRQDCQQLCKSINLEGFEISYKQIDDDFRSNENSEYLEINHTFDYQEKMYLLKGSLVYSVAFKFPTLYFHIYDMDYQKPLDLLKATELIKQRELEINGAKKNIELIQDIHPVLGFSYLTFHQCRMREVIEQIQQIQVHKNQNKNNKETEDQYFFSPTITSLMILLKEFNIYLPKEIYKQLQIQQ